MVLPLLKFLRSQNTEKGVFIPSSTFILVSLQPTTSRDRAKKRHLTNISLVEGRVVVKLQVRYTQVG